MSKWLAVSVYGKDCLSYVKDLRDLEEQACHAGCIRSLFCLKISSKFYRWSFLSKKLYTQYKNTSALLINLRESSNDKTKTNKNRLNQVTNK